jgi:hypothetical protein
MGDITRVITLGIGPASNIEGLVLTGLNVGIVFTGLRATSIKRTIAGLDFDRRLPNDTIVIKRQIAGLDVDSR